MAVTPTMFKSSGRKIAAFLDIPNAENPPTIIYSHGFTSSGTKEPTPVGTHKVVKTAEKLRDIGFQVLRFDYRGLGKSEGKILEDGLAGEIEDLNAAYDFALARGFERISVLASSLGCAVAILSYDYMKPKSMVLWNPVTNLETFTHPYRDYSENDVREVIRKGESIIFDDDGKKYPLGTRYLKELMDFKDGSRSDLDIQTALSKVKCPTLVIHGTADEVLSFEESKESFKKIPAKIKKFVMIQGSGHGFYPMGSEYERKAIVATIEWFDKNGR